MNRAAGQGAATPGSEAENMAWEQANGSAFQGLLGYRLALWEPDRAVIEYDVDAGHLNRSGVLHGGVLVTLLDTAAGYAGCHCAVPGRIRRTLQHFQEKCAALFRFENAINQRLAERFQAKWAPVCRPKTR